MDGLESGVAAYPQQLDPTAAGAVFLVHNHNIHWHHCIRLYFFASKTFCLNTKKLQKFFNKADTIV